MADRQVKRHALGAAGAARIGLPVRPGPIHHVKHVPLQEVVQPTLATAPQGAAAFVLGQSARDLHPQRDGPRRVGLMSLTAEAAPHVDQHRAGRLEIVGHGRHDPPRHVYRQVAIGRRRPEQKPVLAALVVPAADLAAGDEILDRLRLGLPLGHRLRQTIGRRDLGEVLGAVEHGGHGVVDTPGVLGSVHVDRLAGRQCPKVGHAVGGDHRFGPLVLLVVLAAEEDDVHLLVEPAQRL